MKTLRKIILVFIYHILVKNILKLFVGVEFSDNSTFKNTKNFVVVGNHNSHIDTMAIMASMPISKFGKIHPVAAYDYFGNRPFKRFVSKFFLDAVFVDRKKDNFEAKSALSIKRIADSLIDGHSVIFFPEGSRGTPDIMTNFRKGVAHLLKQAPGVPFVPVHMKGFGSALPKGDPILIPHIGSIKIGKPCYIDTNMDTEDILDIMKNKILELA